MPPSVNGNCRPTMPSTARGLCPLSFRRTSVTTFRRLFFVAAAVLAAASLAIEASSSKFFQTATQADFLKGEVENLSVDARGQLSLGPATDLVYETAAPFVWAIAAAG